MEIVRRGGLGVEMFGSNHQDQDAADNAQAAPPAANGLASFTMDPAHKDAANPGIPSEHVGLPPEPTASTVGDATSAPHLDNSTLPADGQAQPTDTTAVSLPPALPSNDTSSTLADIEANVAAASNNDANDRSATSVIGNDDLLSIKQQALTELSPLVSHLEQSPEEKFKTLMMMIQANDNQDLIKDAYAAAQAITDEKAKSQALLDVVNEINYFTQKKK